MSTDDLEEYESEVELQLYREYKDVCPMFTYVVETERRFYLANQVDQQVRTEGGRTWIELTLEDAWVWDMYRQNRFVSSVTVVTFKDVNVEELPKEELEAPDPLLDGEAAGAGRRRRGAGGGLVRGPRLRGRGPQLALPRRRDRPDRAPAAHDRVLRGQDPHAAPPSARRPRR